MRARRTTSARVTTRDTRSRASQIGSVPGLCPCAMRRSQMSACTASINRLVRGESTGSPQRTLAVREGKGMHPRVERREVFSANDDTRALARARRVLHVLFVLVVLLLALSVFFFADIAAAAERSAKAKRDFRAHHPCPRTTGRSALVLATS